MKSSNFVGCSIGKSAGLAPLSCPRRRNWFDSYPESGRAIGLGERAGRRAVWLYVVDAIKDRSAERSVSSNTASAPATTADATRPSALTSTAVGVPPAPKALLTAEPWSRSTREWKPSSLVVVSSEVETTTSLGDGSFLDRSHANSRSRIARQKPQLEFQKRRITSDPRSEVSEILGPSIEGMLMVETLRAPCPELHHRRDPHRCAALRHQGGQAGRAAAVSPTKRAGDG
jgi:hypothetical protein